MAEPGYDEDGEPLVKGVISAVGTAVGNGATGTKSALAVKIQAAMTKAIEEAQAEGITDPDEIRDRALAVRDRLLDEE